MLKQKRLLGGLGAAAFVALSALLTGCPSTPEPPPAVPPLNVGVGNPPPPNGPLSPAGGKTCNADNECGAGQICSFAPGCGPGVCAPQHPCTRDLVPYCGCDGQTFRGSSTCPSRTFARKGPCDAGGPPGAKKACSSSADCQRGEECLGNEGCGAPWTCTPSPKCTKDLVEYCGCDGKSFEGSGTCPGKPVRRRGKC